MGYVYKGGIKMTKLKGVVEVSKKWLEILVNTLVEWDQDRRTSHDFFSKEFSGSKILNLSIQEVAKRSFVVHLEQRPR